MAIYKNRGLKRWVHATRFSFNGFAKCFKHEEAFRQEIFSGLLIIPLGLYLGDSGVERAILAGSWLLVLIVELLNSAVEANVDRVGMEHHQLSARAKDIASAAVFTSLVFTLLVWGLILWPKFF